MAGLNDLRRNSALPTVDSSVSAAGVPTAVDPASYAAPVDPTFLGEAVKGVEKGIDTGQALYGSGLRAAGELVQQAGGPQSVVDYAQRTGQDIQQRNEAEAAAINLAQPNATDVDWSNPSQIINWAGGAVGQVLGSAALVAPAAAAGAVVGGATGAMTGLALASAPQHLGETTDALAELNDGQRDPLAALPSAAANTALDVFGPSRITKQFVKGAGAPNLIKRVGKTAFEQGTIEAGTETLQGETPRLTKAYQDPAYRDQLFDPSSQLNADLANERINTAATSFIGGGALGGVGGIATGNRDALDNFIVEGKERARNKFGPSEDPAASMAFTPENLDQFAQIAREIRNFPEEYYANEDSVREYVDSITRDPIQTKRILRQMIDPNVDLGSVGDFQGLEQEEINDLKQTPGTVVDPYEGVFDGDSASSSIADTEVPTEDIIFNTKTKGPEGDMVVGPHEPFITSELKKALGLSISSADDRISRNIDGKDTGLIVEDDKFNYSPKPYIDQVLDVYGKRFQKDPARIEKLKRLEAKRVVKSLKKQNPKHAEKIDAHFADMSPEQTLNQFAVVARSGAVNNARADAVESSDLDPQKATPSKSNVFVAELNKHRALRNAVAPTQHAGESTLSKKLQSTALDNMQKRDIIADGEVPSENSKGVPQYAPVGDKQHVDLVALTNHGIHNLPFAPKNATAGMARIRQGFAEGLSALAIQHPEAAAAVLKMPKHTVIYIKDDKPVFLGELLAVSKKAEIAARKEAVAAALEGIKAQLPENKAQADKDFAETKKAGKAKKAERYQTGMENMSETLTKEVSRTQSDNPDFVALRNINDAFYRTKETLKKDDALGAEVNQARRSKALDELSARVIKEHKKKSKNEQTETRSLLDTLLFRIALAKKKMFSAEISNEITDADSIFYGDHLPTTETVSGGEITGAGAYPKGRNIAGVNEDTEGRAEESTSLENAESITETTSETNRRFRLAKTELNRQAKDRGYYLEALHEANIFYAGEFAKALRKNRGVRAKAMSAVQEVASQYLRKLKSIEREIVAKDASISARRKFGAYTTVAKRHMLQAIRGEFTSVYGLFSGSAPPRMGEVFGTANERKLHTPSRLKAAKPKPKVEKVEPKPKVEKVEPKAAKPKPKVEKAKPKPKPIPLHIVEKYKDAVQYEKYLAAQIATKKVSGGNIAKLENNRAEYADILDDLRAKWPGIGKTTPTPTLADDADTVVEKAKPKPKVEKVEPKAAKPKPKVEKVEPKPKVEKVEPKAAKPKPKVEKVEPKAAKPKPKVEETPPPFGGIPDDVLADMQSHVDTASEHVGMESPKIDTAEQAATFLGVNKPAWESRWNSGKIHGFTYIADGKVRIAINPKIKDKTTRTDILNHEFGHAVYRTVIGDTTSSAIDGVVNQFNRWVSQYKKGSLKELIGSKKNNRGAILAMLNVPTDQKISDLSPELQKYALDFEEWFADNVSTWMASPKAKQAKTAVGRFFQKIATMLRKLFDKIKGKLPENTVHEYLNSLVRGTDRLFNKVKFSDVIKTSEEMHPDVDAFLTKVFGSSKAVNYIDSIVAIMKDDTSSGLMQLAMGRAIWTGDLFTTHEASVLGRMAASPSIQRQMKAALGNDPQTLRDLADPAQATGYMFQMWYNKKLNISATGKSIFNRFLVKLRKFMGLVSDSEASETIMKSFVDGRIAKRKHLGKGRSVVERYVESNKIGSFMEQHAKTLEAFYKPIRTLFFNADSQIRATKNPALIQLANMWHTKAGNSTGLPTYENSKQAFFGKFTNQILAIFEPHKNDAAFGHAVLEKLQNPEFKATEEQTLVARKVRAVLQRVRKYMTDAGVEVGDLGPNYFPWVFDMETVEANAEEFHKLLSQPKFKKQLTSLATSINNDRLQFNADADWHRDNKADTVAKMAAAGEKTTAPTPLLSWEEVPNEIISTMAGADGFADLDPSVVRDTPSLRFANKRMLSYIEEHGSAHDMEVLTQFMQKDLGNTINSYIAQSVKRTEYVRRLGQNGGRLEDILLQAQEDYGASNEEIKLARNYMHAVMGTYGRETAEWLYQKLGIPLPEAGRPINMKLQKMMGSIMVVKNLALLSLATLTSLADPIGIAVRTGDMRLAMSSMKEGVKNAVALAKGKRTELNDMATMLGTIDHALVNEALGWEYGGVYMGGLSKKINEAFFKFTMLSQWTRLTRVAALAGGRSFLAKHAKRPNKHSARYLDELGVKASDITVNAEGQTQILTYAERKDAAKAVIERDDRVRAALNQFVDESILRPNASQRPIWASDPHWMLVFHLKSFMYSFHDRILSRVWHENMQGNYLPMLNLMAFIPAMVMIDALRDEIKFGDEGSDWKRDWGFMDYLWNGVERAGLTGVAGAFLSDVSQAHEFGDMTPSSIVGPTLDPLLSGQINWEDYAPAGNILGNRFDL